MLSREEGFFRLKRRRVQAVDTTGAGDVFHGAFLHAFLKTGSVETSARFANAAAARKCEGMTGRAPIPSEEEIWRLAQALTLLSALPLQSSRVRATEAADSDEIAVIPSSRQPLSGGPFRGGDPRARKLWTSRVVERLIRRRAPGIERRLPPGRDPSRDRARDEARRRLPMGGCRCPFRGRVANLVPHRGCPAGGCDSSGSGF